MPKSEAKDPQIEIKAKVSGSNQFKEWTKELGKSKSGNASSGMGNVVYGLGLIGALVYYLQAATDFGSVVVGILKALVWPAFVVYKLLESFYGFVR